MFDGITANEIALDWVPGAFLGSSSGSVSVPGTCRLRDAITSTAVVSTSTNITMTDRANGTATIGDSENV